MRKQLILIIVLFLLPLHSYADERSDTARDEDEIVEQLVQEALRNNPRLKAVEARLEALEQRITSAGIRPDPMIGLALMNYPVAANPFDIGRFPMTQTQVSVSQTFPSSGTLKWRRELSRWDYRLGKHDAVAEQLAISTLLRKALVDIAAAQSWLEITRENQRLHEQIAASARAKYESGAGDLQNVLRAEV